MRTRPDFLPRRIRRPGMFAGGDGSTLSLDFTSMSGLDTRFTFSRASTATFINSSGLVQYADHNLVTNSAFAGSGMGTGWAQNGVAATNSGTGTLTFSVTTAAVSFASRSIATAAGLRYSAAVNVSSITGTIQYQEVLAIGGSISSTQMYRNGVAVSASATAQPGLISITWTSGGANTIRFGVGASGNNQTNVTVAVDTPRAIAGEVTQPTYFASTATDPYHAPRFDHDPTTLARRGLLIEGSATNLLCWSESFATSGGSTNWAYNTNTGAVVSTSNPQGGSTAFQFAETANSGPLQQSVTVTNAVHTFSAWFKGSTYSGVTTTQVQFGLFVAAFVAGTAAKISGPGSVSVASNIVTLSGLSTSEWTRVQFTTAAALSAGSVAILIYPNSTSLQLNASFYIWGAQLEAGSGASSYIPTGSSTVQRAADECVITGTSFSSWFNSTAGTFLAHALRSRTSDVGRIASANDNTASESIDIGASTTGQFIVTDGGSALATITPGTVTANTAFKIAGAFALNNVQAALGGTLGTADTSVTLPTVTQLHIGRQGGASPVYLNGTVSLLKFWPTRLPDATLQSLTA